MSGSGGFIKLGIIGILIMGVYTAGYAEGYSKVKPPIVHKVIKTVTEVVPQFYPMDKKALEYVTSIIPQGMYKPLPPKSPKDLKSNTKKPTKKSKTKTLLAQR